MVSLVYATLMDFICPVFPCGTVPVMCTDSLLCLPLCSGRGRDADPDQPGGLPEHGHEGQGHHSGRPAHLQHGGRPHQDLPRGAASAGDGGAVLHSALTPCSCSMLAVLSVG